MVHLGGGENSSPAFSVASAPSRILRRMLWTTLHASYGVPATLMGLGKTVTGHYDVCGDDSGAPQEKARKNCMRVRALDVMEILQRSVQATEERECFSGRSLHYGRTPYRYLHL